MVPDSRQPSVPSQLHRRLDRLDALGPGRDGMIERGLEPPISVYQFRVLVARDGNSRAGYQLALPHGT